MFGFKKKKMHTETEISKLLDQNKLSDLKKNLGRRKCLNETNFYLVYLFHLVQSCGIIVTSYATGTNNSNLIWIGISLNMVATILNLYEKTNNTLSKKLLTDIKMIKDGTYLDENLLVETNQKNTYQSV
jgi:hypothetical protein